MRIFTIPFMGRASDEVKAGLVLRRASAAKTRRHGADSCWWRSFLTDREAGGAEAVAGGDLPEAVPADRLAAMGAHGRAPLAGTGAGRARDFVGAGLQGDVARRAERRAADRALRQLRGHDGLAEAALHLPADALERLGRV